MSEAPERIFAVIIDGKLEASVNPIRSPLAREYTVRADLLPVVKPLVWTQELKGRWVGVPPNKIGNLAFWVFQEADKFVRITKDGKEEYPTLEAAKAAAQADYEARIRASLDMIDPAALVAGAYEAAIDDLREQLAEARLSELAALGQAQDAHTAQLEAEARALRVGEAVREAAVNLIQAVESNDRPNWASHGSWAHACELYAMSIYALDVSKIAQGVK